LADNTLAVYTEDVEDTFDSGAVPASRGMSGRQEGIRVHASAALGSSVSIQMLGIRGALTAFRSNFDVEAFEAVGTGMNATDALAVETSSPGLSERGYLMR
jgi:hypothetical protein